MIDSAIKTLLAVGQASNAKVVPGVRTPDNIALIEHRDGSVKEYEIPHGPANHQAYDLNTVIRQCIVESDSGSEIWYSREGVVGLLDCSDRRERCTLKLGFSPQILKLSEPPKNMTQKEFLLLLRTTYADCGCDQLVGIVRNLKFANNQSGASSVTHGGVSVGRSIEQSVTGASSIPENVILSVPIFDRYFSCVGKIKCAIDIDASTETFRLIPLPLQIERAIRDAESFIGESIAGMDEKHKLLVYYGIP